MNVSSQLIWVVMATLITSPRGVSPFHGGPDIVWSKQQNNSTDLNFFAIPNISKQNHAASDKTSQSLNMAQSLVEPYLNIVTNCSKTASAFRNVYADEMVEVTVGRKISDIFYCSINPKLLAKKLKQLCILTTEKCQYTAKKLWLTKVCKGKKRDVLIAEVLAIDAPVCTRNSWVR